MGAQDAYKMRYEFQMWRFVTALVLHLNLTHLIGSLAAIALLFPILEQDLGLLKFSGLLLITGIGGTLFSVTCSPKNDIKCGPSPIIYGILGFYFSCLIMNWTYLKEHSERRCHLLIYVVVCIIVGLYSSVESEDPYGSLGGFLVGIMAGMLLLP